MDASPRRLPLLPSLAGPDGPEVESAALLARTHCPYCALQCGLVLTEGGEGGRVEARGDEAFPVNEGALCMKGFSSPELLEHPERLRAPLARDERGRLVEVSWEEALSRVAGAFSRIREAWGAAALGVFGSGALTNEKAYLLGKLARVAMGTPNIDYNGRFCMSSAAAAGVRAFGLDRGLPFPLDDIAETDLVLLVGSNPLETMPPLGRYLEALRRRGGRLVVVDPRSTPTASGASLHLRLSPGTDAALAHGLLHVLVRDGLIDEAFVSDHTEGFDEVRRLVAGYWPGRVEQITGVPEAQIVEAATMLGRAGRAIVLTGRGPEQQAQGVRNALAFINVALALGLPGRQASGYGCLTGQGNGQGGREHGQKADQLPGYRRIDDPVARRHVASVWGLDEASLPGAGVSACELLGSLGPGGVRGLLVVGSNVLVSAPDAGQIKKRLASLDALVVVDFFLSETAELAHVVLPSAQFAEEEGTMTNLEGRVVRRRALRPPPRGVKTDLEILCELGQRLDPAGAWRFSFSGAREVFDELRRATAGGQADYAGISYEKIDAQNGVFWPCPSDDHPGTPRPFARGFPTATGRARFHASPHQPQAEVVDDDYPLWLTTGRLLAHYQSGTQTRRTPRLAAMAPEPRVEIHPATARRFGVRDGEPVALSTRRGRARFIARLSSTIREDTIFVPFHWGGEGCANRLTHPALDPISRMPEFKVCAAKLEPERSNPRPGGGLTVAQKSRLVVIGNGMAGARLVEEIVLRGGRDRFELVMFGDEPYGNYNRILLSNVLAGAHDARDIFLNPLSWYEEHGIRLHAGVRATLIDRDDRVVLGERGVVEPYDQLVIATGSSAFVPPIDGLRRADGGLKDGAFAFRSLDDCTGMLARAERSQCAVIIGGGLLGLEAARGLLQRGLEVHVVHLAPYLMETQLDEVAGGLLKRRLEQMGVVFHMPRRTRAALGDERVEGLSFDDGTELLCDMVVVSAGITPNASLARASGLLVRRGIVVGDDLRCEGEQEIYSLGECCEHRGLTYGIVAPLWEQAQVLADRLSGKNPGALYRGSRISTKLKVAGVDLAVMGDKASTDPADEEVSYVEPSRGVYKKLVVRHGKLQGAIVLGDAAAVPSLVQAFDRRSELPENRAEVLFALAPTVIKVGVGDLPDDAQICNCNGVSKGDIVTAVRAGCRSLKVLCDKTRAGMGCGGCKGDVSALLELAAGDAVVVDPSIHYYVPGVPYPKPELVRLIRERGLKSVSAVFASLAGGKEDAASKPGLASLLRTLWGKDYQDERDARFINDRVHANIQRDGTFSVVPRIYGGVTSPEELRKIADVAERYQAKMVKVTGGQRIDLLGIPREHLPDVWRELGMPSGHAYTKSVRTCKTCVGTEFCRYGVGDSTGLGIAIERRYQGLEAPAKLKLATAGCPRNCSEATTKDVGAVAIEGGRWEIYVGGAAGARVRKGDLLVVVDSHDEVLRLMGRFMQYYRENARYSERTYDFVERLGLDEIRAVVVDDRDGVAASLDAAVEAAVEAYVDPWLEAEKPAHPSQFTGVFGGPKADAAE